MQISRCCALLACLSLPVIAQPISFNALDAAAGKALFDKNWVQAPASTTSSDGLGPHYSNRSCAACHPGGGRGLGVQSYTVQTDDPVYGLRLHQHSLALVPREANISWVVAGPDQTGVTDLLPPDQGQSLVMHPAISDLAYGPLQSAWSVRIAPSLAGLGLLEQVPNSVLLELADPDDDDGDGVSGRVAWLEQDATGIQAGRFGWKATSASLQTQTALALSLDIGIGNPLHPAPWGDCTAVQSACRISAAETGTYPVDKMEAGQVILDLLVAYLASLPAPAPTVPGRQNNGPDLFQRIGCADCHVPELPSGSGVVRAYTDLLLHDMGPQLDDGLAEGAANSGEWRTAPLWSLSASGPYLHDGRAATLAEAISLHGGEAGNSLNAYRQLNRTEQAGLIAFLLGL